MTGADEASGAERRHGGDDAQTDGETRSWLSAGWLIVIGAGLVAVSVAAALALHRQSNDGYVAAHIVHVVLYGSAIVWLLRRKSTGRALGVIITAAIVMRLIALFVPPTLTTDAYRYVWDGRVQADGVNPYLYVPADPKLAHLRDEAIYPNINRAETHPTIYPPVAEMAFFLGTRIIDGIRGQQIVMLGFDLVTIAALLAWLGQAGLARARVLVYAWHPLTVWEFAGMAHIDAAAVTFVTLACLAGARGRQALAGVAFAAAGLVKYHYVLFVPAVWRRWRLALPVAMAAAVVAFYLPYLSAGPKVLGSLFTHLGEEGYQDGYGFYFVGLPRHFGLPFIPPPVFAGLAAVALAAAGLAAVLRADPERISAGWLVALGALFLVLVSPHYPWYYAMVLPLLTRRLYWPLLWPTLTVSLVYLDITGWLEPYTRFKVFNIMFIGLAVLAAIEVWHRKRRAC